MAIGLITNPAAWFNGTVISPTWAQQVQDNINGWIAGTGPTLKALQVDGTGGSTSVLPAGLLSTRNAEFSETWQIANATLSTQTLAIADLQKRWDFRMTGTTQRLTYQNPSSTYPARSVLINNGTAGLGERAWLTNAFTVLYPSFNFSWQVDFQVTSLVGSAQEVYLGLGDAQGLDVSGQRLQFYKDFTLTNWQYVGTSGTFNDSGVAPVIGTWQRFRIDYAAGAVKFFINGTQVGSLTNAITTPLYLNFGGRTPNAGTSTYTVGDVRLLYTTY